MQSIKPVVVVTGLLVAAFALVGVQCPSNNAGTVEVVTLSHPIFTDNGPDYSPGDTFPLSDITDGEILPADASCAVPHLHAVNLLGIFINGIGPYPDPDITGCGYGAVTFEQFPTVVP